MMQDQHYFRSNECHKLKELGWSEYICWSLKTQRAEKFIENKEYFNGAVYNKQNIDKMEEFGIYNGDDLQKLISQYELAKDGEIIKSLEEKINTFQELNKDILNENYIADQTLIELSFIPEDTSFAGIYNELIKLDDFKDSDII